jgi:lysophospholipase L1-like esterase
MLAQPNVGEGSGTPTPTPTHKKILAFGDSLTAGYYRGGGSFNPYANRLGALLGSEWQVVEVGWSGETTTEMVRRLPTVLQAFKLENVTFDYILILGGTNDLFGNDAATITSNLVRLHKTGRDYGAKTLAISIPEHGMERKKNFTMIGEKRLQINEALRKLAAETESTAFFDLAVEIPRFGLSDEEVKTFWDDGLHFTAKGYDRFGELVFERLRALAWVCVLFFFFFFLVFARLLPLGFCSSRGEDRRGEVLSAISLLLNVGPAKRWTLRNTTNTQKDIGLW